MPNFLPSIFPHLSEKQKATLRWVAFSSFPILFEFIFSLEPAILREVSHSYNKEGQQ